jgi:hypothetical protein
LFFVRGKPYGKPRDAVNIPLKKIQLLPGKGSQKQGTLKTKLKRDAENDIFINLQMAMNPVNPQFCEGVLVARYTLIPVL